MGVVIRRQPPLYLETVRVTGINPAGFTMPPDVVGCTNVRYRKMTKEVWEALNGR